MWTLDIKNEHNHEKKHKNSLNHNTIRVRMRVRENYFIDRMRHLSAHLLNICYCALSFKQTNKKATPAHMKIFLLLLLSHI